MKTFFAAAITAILYLTNPTNIDEHREAYLKHFNEKYVGVKDENSELDNALNKIKNLDKALFGETFIGGMVSYKNFYLCSFTTINNKVVGIGLLGKVFIFP
jgi:hypothetical protein